MELARSIGRGVSRLLAMVIFLLAGLGLWPRLQPPANGCRAGAHACCCAPSGLDGCACAGHQGPAARLASLAACGDSGDALAHASASTPGLSPLQSPILLALLPVGVLLTLQPAAAETTGSEPSAPPPRLPFPI
jgi:hypothetical protein